MKHYIILASGLFNMGGAEMFTSNKCRYLSSIGWRVKVFYFRAGNKIMIDGLAEFRQNRIPELIYGITYVNKAKRKEILDKICMGIKHGDQVVVESHIMNLAYWGELIAKRTGAKNILNSMEENINQLTKKEAAFVEYKMKRWEILNASVKSFHRYFNNLYKEEYANYVHKYMRAYCSNVVDENTSFQDDVRKADFNIMSVGRLDKPYVHYMLQEVLSLVCEKTQYQFNFLIIGGSPDGSVEEEIEKMFSSLQNVKVYLYGYMFPIPLNLLNKADVSIATANSILVTSNLGIPTIAIDIHDNYPMGIYGKSTTNLFSRDEEPIQQISYLLKQVLIDEVYKKEQPLEIDTSSELEAVFSKQVDFLELSSDDHKAYDVESMYPWYKYIYDQTKKYIHQVMGNE